MAGHIPSSGSVSMSTAAGDTRSMYRLRNIKRSTGDTSQQAMSTLRDWFRTYVNPAGDAGGNFPDSGNQIAFSNFRDMKIWGCAVRSQNETTSTYNTDDNAKLKVYGLNGTSDYAFTIGGVEQNPSGAAEVEFSKSATGQSFNGDGTASHTLTVKDEGGTSAEFTLTWVPGYGTGQAKIEGTTTSGTNNQAYNWSTNSPSSYSEYSYFYVEEADPSGTAYG